VDPVDNFSLANPPSNDRLLDALARDFREHKFDIRHLERAILNSRTYQLSSTMNETNKLDRNNYSHSYVRTMMAEVVLDVLNSALGVTEDFGPDAPPGSRAIEVASTRVASPNAAFVFRTFGRPDRNRACECERAMEPALAQTLYLMTDPVVLQKLRGQVVAFKGKGKAPPAKGKAVPAKGKPVAAPPAQGRLAKLLQSARTDAEILDELFLATLTRFPTAAEKKHFADYRAARQAHATDPPESPKQKKLRTLALRNEREEAFTDALWALINTREFILNH
jgi:hypothetical protein